LTEELQSKALVDESAVLILLGVVIESGVVSGGANISSLC
jgi:hypothetical protein